MVKLLKRALPEKRQNLAQRDRAVAEHCLAALVSYAYMSAEPADRTRDVPRHVRDAMMFIEENGTKRTTLDDVAGAVGYSRSYLASEFRKHTGTNIKAAIDRARAEAAGRLLAYSDHSITEIADLLSFPDVYSFSRFFRRTSGRSPRAYRKGQSVDVSAGA
jgi:AraC family transcriptional activator of pobA